MILETTVTKIMLAPFNMMELGIKRTSGGLQ